MSNNASISFGDHLDGFIERQVTTGRYSSVSDVVRAGLHLLEERETKVAALQAALDAGEQSGQATPFSFDAFIARKRAGTTTP